MGFGTARAFCRNSRALRGRGLRDSSVLIELCGLGCGPLSVRDEQKEVRRQRSRRFLLQQLLGERRLRERPLRHAFPFVGNRGRRHELDGELLDAVGLDERHDRAFDRAPFGVAGDALHVGRRRLVQSMLKDVPADEEPAQARAQWLGDLRDVAGREDVGAR